MMTVQTASGFIAGKTYDLAANTTLVIVQVQTWDRANLNGATVSITATGKSYTPSLDATGRAEIVVDSGLTYNVHLSISGDYLNDDDQSFVANNEEVVWVNYNLSEPAIQTITNTTVSTWASDNTYPDYPYRAAIPITGVTANDVAEVMFDVDQAISGDYAPVTVTYSGGVYIYSAVNDSITIPTIVIMHHA